MSGVGLTPWQRVRRSFAVTSTAAGVYLGYKAIQFQERRLGLDSARAQAKRRAHHRRSAQAAYRAAVDLQGLLIKACQLIGSRADILPEEYVVVLSRLQDQVPPRPFAVIEEQVRRELGRRPERIFAEFDREPVAAASLAQVHRARLRDGRPVAVKVQYPGIEELVRGDLQNLLLLLGVLSRLERGFDVSSVAQELQRNVPQELDFINEGRNAETMARHFAGFDAVVVPGIVWEHTTRRVLVMELVGGVKVTDVAGLEAAGIDRQAVARLLIDAYFRQMFVHGFFHADPHPGNLFVQPGPRLVFVDFGLAKTLSPAFRAAMVRLTRALMAQDEGAMAGALLDMGFRTRNGDPKTLVALGQAFVGTALLSGRPYADPDMVTEVNRRLARVFRDNPVTRVPADILLIGRVMGLLSGLSKQLDSQVNVLETLRPYALAGSP